MGRKPLTPSCHSDFTQKMAIKWKIEGQIHSLQEQQPEKKINNVYNSKCKTKSLLPKKKCFYFTPLLL